MASSLVTPKAFLGTAGLLWITLFTIAESEGVGPTSTPLPNPNFSKCTYVFTLVARCVCAYFVRLLKAVVHLYTVRPTKIWCGFSLYRYLKVLSLQARLQLATYLATLAFIQLTSPVRSLV